MGQLAPGARLALSLLLASCAPPPLPEPSPEGSAAIGIEHRERGLIRLFQQPGRPVLFVRIDEGSGSLPSAILPASFAKGGRSYLLGVAPGRYAAVASHGVDRYDEASGRLTQEEFLTLYSEELVALSELHVAAGQFAFMGRFVIDHGHCAKADRVQSHYYELLVGTLVSRRAFCWTGSPHEVARDAAARRTFLERARRDLAGTGWAPLLDRE